MANRRSGLDLSVRAALVLFSVLHVDSPKIRPEQHIWLLGRQRGSSAAQGAPAIEVAAELRATAVPELPAKSASDDLTATGVIHPAVVTPPLPAKDAKIRYWDTYDANERNYYDWSYHNDDL
ncbi:hypothetical protein HQO82_11955 [Rhodococcus fascians]|nr:hypothetical protein [Rhodococcus fascians]MBY4114539.1 hypothetical protein [Rhodococcus fascians]